MNAVLNAFTPFQDAAVMLVSYLVTALWMGVAIAALTALLVRVWKPLDAATRYLVWYVALIAVVLGPLVTVVAMHHAHRSAFDAADGVAAVWLLVVLAGALRVGAAAAVLVRLKRDSLPLSPERRAALPLWQSHANAAGARPARLCVSDRVEVPVAVGLFDSMVVFPEQVVDAFEPGDIDRFVLHELAHLNRLSLRVEQLLSAHRFTAPRTAYAPAGVILAASLGVLATAAPVAPAFASTGVRASSRVDTAAVVIVERDGNVTAS